MAESDRPVRSWLSGSWWPGLRRSDPEIAERVGQVDAGVLRQHVEAIAAVGPRSVHDPAALVETLAYLKAMLQQYGYAVEQEPFGDRPGQVNLLAELRGTARPDAIMELGAHYDTVPGTPGADDNASGVAGVLEVARVLAGAPGRRTIRLCLFGEEESGLGGSRGHVARLADQPQRQVEGIFVYEMIGYCTRQPNSQRTPLRLPLILWPPRIGDFIVVAANARSRSLATRFEKAARLYVPELPLYTVRWLGGFLADAARSDHLPYWSSGRRGVMLTDTANFRNPHYHQPTDQPETLDYHFLAAVVRTTLATLMQWAKR